MKNYSEIGICIFAIAYGLMEVSNAVYVYRNDKKNRRNLIIIVIWGLSILLVSTGEILRVPKAVEVILYLLFGISWFPLMSVPCSLKLFRINKTTILIRKLIFLIIGITQFFIVGLTVLNF